MPALRQQIRFAVGAGGARIAYALSGQGPPLVRAANWMSHLEQDWRTPVWGPWYERLSRRHCLIRHDPRGCGLSDREVASLDIDAMVADLAAVIDAAGLQRFSLMGTSQGGAVAIRYAARHPQRVERLVLMAAYARGALHRGAVAETPALVEAQAQLIEAGWGRDNPAFRQLFTTQFWPQATPQQAQAMNEMQRVSCAPAHAARMVRALAQVDVSDDLPQVACPTLVLHCTDDGRIPFDEGRRLAASIGGARFEPLASRNHVPLLGEPAFDAALATIDAFLPGGSTGAFAGLSARERDIVEALARGLDNAQIAARLGLAEKTVRNLVSAVFARLGVENRAQAIVRAREHGFGHGGDG